jgi:hypothetical protein
LAVLCSECGGPLVAGDGKKLRPDAKTCGPKCRSTRSRRLKRAKKQSALTRSYPPHAKEAAEHIDPHGHGSEVRDVAHKLLEDALRPVVREAITEDALKAIRSMVGLTPRVIQLLEIDMESDDATVRQRAYTLIAKYTLGHQAIVTPESQGAGQQMVVHFDLPRPGASAPLDGQPVLEAEAVETQECETCHIVKPLDEFVASSQRCIECYEGLQRQVAERFGTEATS